MSGSLTRKRRSKTGIVAAAFGKSETCRAPLSRFYIRGRLSLSYSFIFVVNDVLKIQTRIPLPAVKVSNGLCEQDQVRSYLNQAIWLAGCFVFKTHKRVTIYFNCYDNIQALVTES